MPLESSSRVIPWWAIGDQTSIAGAPGRGFRRNCVRELSGPQDQNSLRHSSTLLVNSLQLSSAVIDDSLSRHQRHLRWLGSSRRCTMTSFSKPAIGLGFRGPGADIQGSPVQVQGRVEVQIRSSILCFGESPNRSRRSNQQKLRDAVPHLDRDRAEIITERFQILSWLLLSYQINLPRTIIASFKATWSISITHGTEPG
jgi:hypothetical protein